MIMTTFNISCKGKEELSIFPSINKDIADGIENGAICGNQFVFNVGEWAPDYSEAHAYFVNTSESTGDFQLGYKNLEITSFIVRTETETADNYTVNLVRVYENLQNISLNKFNYGGKNNEQNS